MKIIIENTDRVVDLILPNGSTVPARIWEGETEDGLPMHCYITRVCIAKDTPPDKAAVFERDLRECRPMSPALMRAIPLRLIL